MELEVKNPEGLPDIGDFCEYLITEMTDYATDPANQDPGLVAIWNDYFESTDLGWPRNEFGDPVAPTFQYITYQWFSHLDWFESKGSFYIIPDTNLRLNSTDITIDSLAQMINFGVLGVSAYRYFEDILDLVAEEISELYMNWAEPDSEDGEEAEEDEY